MTRTSVPGQMVRRDIGERPLRIDLDEVEVGPDREREAHALERAEPERAPPHRHAGAPGVGRQGRDVLDDALRPHSSSSFEPFGQNQPTSAIATGIDPHTTAQGVKIEPTKRTETAIAASSGQIDGSGELSRMSARASVTVVTTSWRSSTARPPTTGSAWRSAHSGSRLVTSGMRVKFCGGGGEVVAHSSVPAPQGLSPATSPWRALVIEVPDEQREAQRQDHGADRGEEVQAAPAHLGLIGVDAARHALQPEDVHREEGEVEADEGEPEMPAAEAFAHHPAA